MNDDSQDEIERRLRAGLRGTALPGAPDGLRDRLAGIPAGPRGSLFSGLLSGLRLAALGSAAAVAIAFVLVARSLSAPTSTGPGSSLAARASSAAPSASVPPSSGASVTAPSPAPARSAPPALTGASLAPPTCNRGTVLPGTTGAVVPITDVRAGTHPGYDRIVFEFSGSARPELTVAVAKPPFVGDASGRQVAVAGKVFLSLKLFDASGYPTYTGPASYAPKYPNLVALVNTGDYEGYVTWIAGLATSTCYEISTLSSPTRIVVDVETP